MRNVLSRIRIEPHVSTVGMLFGTLFFALSLTPSLLPRGDVVQGVVSGLCMAAGYAVGALGVWLWRFLHLPAPRERVQHIAYIVAAVLCGLLVIVFLWQASRWQNNVRALMGMDEVAGVRTLVVGSVALLVFAVAFAIGKAFRKVSHLLSRKLGRVVPPRPAYIIGLVLSFYLFWLLVDGVLVSFMLRSADASHKQLDALMEPEAERPTDPMRAGSAASLIGWKDMGRQGRRYLANGPSAADISVVAGQPAREPIRVYVGLNAAETPEERAELALAELKRVGGFERSVLVIIAPTGTGWVDPAGLDPLEYLLRGDVASVAAQYSYLPSPVALMSDGAYGVESTRALFQVVYDHWRGLPRDERPSLYLFGLSLGALNSDHAFDFYDIIADPFDGALWSGPPFRTETWRRTTERRRPDSPEWLPRFRDDSVVRFANQDGGLASGRAPWGQFRIAFLQYASDPITFFSPESFYREPAWMKPPRGPDVSDDLRWFPIVTMLQLAADMAAGTSPPGYGHEFAPEHYLDAWHALVEPEGWSEPALARLRQHFARSAP
jgi:uncharacterized membrane protein